MQAGAAAAWVTVKIWPEMFSVADRVLVSVLTVTDQVTSPVPVPLGVQVSQEVSLLVAVQPHVVVTVTVPEVAAAPGLAPEAERVYVQVGAGAAA